MSQPPELGTLRLDDDSDRDDLVYSPGKPQEHFKNQQFEPTPSRHARNDSQHARDAALRKELENVKSVNKVIEGVIDGLNKAKGNMDVRVIVYSASLSPY